MLRNKSILKSTLRNLVSGANATQEINERPLFGSAAKKILFDIPKKPEKITSGDGFHSGQPGKLSLMRRCVTALFKTERIELPLPVAKEARAYTERLIQLSIQASFQDPRAHKEIVETIQSAVEAKNSSSSTILIDTDKNTAILETCMFWLQKDLDIIQRLFMIRFNLVNSVRNIKPFSSFNSTKRYDTQLVEEKSQVQLKWENILNESTRNTKDEMLILMPPPNVTGNLHLGHALTFYIQDVLSRYNLMNGSNVQWIPGLDHAGIATQSVFEKSIHPRKRHDFSQEEFLSEIQKWKLTKEKTIKDQIKLLNLTANWDREFYTLDQKHSAIVQEAFIQLWNDGKIYQDLRMINWSCALQSVISDIEVEQMELKGRTKIFVPSAGRKVEFGIEDTFSFPIYQDANGQMQSISITTTRLETMLGDTAICVHPDDPRYQHMIGKEFMHPLIPGQKLVVIGDAQAIDPKKGTGAMKVTPGHSFIDFELSRKHNLKVINILSDNGFVNVNGEFHNKDRFHVRNLLRDKLTDLGLFVGTSEVKNPMYLPVCSRSGDVIEPLLKVQWFLNTKDMSNIASQAANEGRLEFHPKSAAASWQEWLRSDKQKDWCLSRQIWWGHKVPIYYYNEHHVAARNKEEAMKLLITKTGLNSISIDQIKQDTNVLDTWFSSSLLPLSISGWPNEKLKSNFPMEFIETGFDILFFWVARMVMMSQYFRRDVPFKKIYLHGMICDKEGKKMSKSKGNVIDPVEVIKSSQKLSGGSDPLRIALLSQTLDKTNIKFSSDMIVNANRFLNKIWQTFKYFKQTFPTHERADNLGDLQNQIFTNNKDTLTIPDIWIFMKLNGLIKQTNEILSGICQFEVNYPINAIKTFWIEDLSSIYLELMKETLKSDNEKHSKKLEFLLLTGISLLHPYSPCLTEFLWQEFGAKNTPVLLSTKYPKLGLLEDFKEAYQKDFEQIESSFCKIKRISSDINAFVQITNCQSLQCSIRCQSLSDYEQVFLSKLVKIGPLNNPSIDLKRCVTLDYEENGKVQLVYPRDISLLKYENFIHSKLQSLRADDNEFHGTQKQRNMNIEFYQRILDCLGKAEM